VLDLGFMRGKEELGILEFKFGKLIWIIVHENSNFMFLVMLVKVE